MSCLGLCSRYTSNETSALAKQGFPHHWKISKEWHILQLHMASMCVMGLNEQLKGHQQMKVCKIPMRSTA
jgi:hypothetical protein